MKLWIPHRNDPNNPNHNRNPPCHTLHNRNLLRLLFNYPYLTRRLPWMTYTKYPRKRGLNILYSNIPTHCPRCILRLLHLQKDLTNRSCPIYSHYINSIHRLHPTMRTNIFLSRHSYHKSYLNRPIYWCYTGRMSLRRIFSWKSNPNSSVRSSLHHTIHDRSHNNHSYDISTRNRLQQSNRIKLKHRQNHISPVLYI